MKGLFLIMGLVFLVSSPAMAEQQRDIYDQSAPELSKLAKELARLQNEVEILYDQVETQKAALRNESRSYEQQRLELEAEIQRTTLAFKKLEQEEKAIQEKLKEQGKIHQKLTPVILYGISLLKDYVDQGLPFKKKERLNLLESLERSLNPEHPKILPERAFNTLWAYYEDEIRLAQDCGLYKQAIEIEGKESLADVAKIGMIAMFFNTSDGKTGLVKNEEGFYTIHVFENDDQRDLVLHLMDSFKKQIKTGYFILPNFFPEVDANVVENEKK